MNNIIPALSLILFGSQSWGLVFAALHIAGLAGIFRKSGISWKWALVPFARHYMLSRCAGREKDGRIYLVLLSIRTFLQLVAMFSTEPLKIASFTLSAAAVTLLLSLVMLLYAVRVYFNLTRVWGLRKRWVFAWVFIRGITSALWGWSKRYAPSLEAGPEKKDMTETVYVPKAGKKWFRDFNFNITRMFDYFSFHGDWKCLPVAVAITILVAAIARNDFFTTMEGTIKGSLALTCIALWNGSFNSICTVCRERDRIRDMKSRGMRPSAYIASVIAFQLIMCLIQTFLTVYTCRLIGIDFPDEGVIFKSLIPEIGITVFLISFAADMVCLLISALVRNAMAAMTILPFVLVVQLVFSGSVINVNVWSKSISRYTISNYGVKCIASQADYNNRPMVMGWTLLNSIRDTEVGKTYTVGQLMDIISSDDSYPAVARVRAMEVGRVFTPRQVTDRIEAIEGVGELMDTDLQLNMSVGEAVDFLMERNIIPSYEKIGEMVFSKTFTIDEIYSILNSTDAMQTIREKTVLNLFEVGDLLDLIIAFFEEKDLTVNIKLDQIVNYVRENETVKAFLDRRPLEGLTVRKILENETVKSFYEKYMDIEIDATFTVGEIVDALLSIKEIQKLRDIEIPLKARIGTLIDAVGEEKVKNFVIEKTTAAVRVPEYVHSRSNIMHYWLVLLIYAACAAAASAVVIEIVMRTGSKKENAQNGADGDPDDRVNLLPSEHAEDKNAEDDAGKNQDPSL